MNIIKTKLFKNLSARITASVLQNHLFTENDKVLIALSGGKDSNAMLFLLKNSFPNLDIAAIHINNNFTKEDYFRPIRNWCEQIDVPIYEIKTNIAEDLKTVKNQPCYRCSFLRKKEIYKWANSNKYKIIALGHHKDDVIETLLINILFASEISSMPYKLSMFNNTLFIIRPMIEIDSKYIKKLINEYNIPTIENPCPYEKNNIREEIRKLILQSDKLKKGVKESIFKSTLNIKPEYLHKFKIK